MISISAAVTIVIYLIVGGLVLGLLFWLISYCESQFPGVAAVWKIARIILVILAVLVLITILLSLVGGQQIFRP